MGAVISEGSATCRSVRVDGSIFFVPFCLRDPFPLRLRGFELDLGLDLDLDEDRARGDGLLGVLGVFLTFLLGVCDLDLDLDLDFDFVTERGVRLALFLANDADLRVDLLSTTIFYLGQSNFSSAKLYNII